MNDGWLRGSYGIFILEYFGQKALRYGLELRKVDSAEPASHRHEKVNPTPTMGIHGR